MLTERGRDFRPVLLAMMAWGNRHFAPEGASVQIVDARTGEPADPVLVDRAPAGRSSAPDSSPIAAAAPPPSARARSPRSGTPRPRQGRAMTAVTAAVPSRRAAAPAARR